VRNRGSIHGRGSGFSLRRVVQIGSDDHASSYSVRSLGGGGALSPETNDRGVKLVIHLESTLRISGAILTLHVPSWHCHI
jgi:hypothetical protein